MIKLVIGKIKNLICPPATQDLELNTKNRDAAVKAEHIQYGPLNVDEPGDYWKSIADSWNTTEEAAKKSLCGNCVAFDISPRMKDCMPGETSDKDGQLGYCWMHHFKCHSARSCRTWAKGGPIKEDDKSLEWQEKNKESLEEKKRKKKKKKKKKKKRDACYYKVKARYKVWPSAYASGALVKCRKKGAKNWGTGGKKKKNETLSLEDIREEVQNILDEKGPSCWKGYKKNPEGPKSGPGSCVPNESLSKDEVEEDLRKWFGQSKSKDGEPGWVNVVTGDSCASDKPGEGVPKCVSSAKRASMTPAERRASAARKRRKDKGQQQKSGAAKPTYVATDSPRKKKKKKRKKT